MMESQDEFLKRLLVTFRQEATEHLRMMASGLIELEKKPSPERSQEIVADIFREAHSLKGAARSVNLSGYERLCHTLENLFSTWQRNEIVSDPGLFDILHQAVDRLERELDPSMDSNRDPNGGLLEMVRQVEEASSGGSELEPAPPRQSPEPESSPTPSSPTDDNLEVRLSGDPRREATRSQPWETVRISVSRLDSLLRQTEELVGAKLSSAHRVSELRKFHARLTSIRRSGKRESSQEADSLAGLEHQLAGLVRTSDRDQRALSTMVDNLLEEMKGALMLPFSSFLEGFPRLVRDLSRTQGKELEVSIQGSEIEIDRRVLEEIKDPVTHLIRNCVDHGIEKPEDRIRRGKGSTGILSISVAPQNGSHVELVISDDGAGFDTEALKSASRKAGLLSEESAKSLSEQEIFQLAFRPGVSTSPLITDISGRGLGLSIVQEKLYKLGGMLVLESKRGKGTCFKMLLPLTLATFRGILIKVGEETLVLPTRSVDRVCRLSPADIATVENRETIRIDEEAVSLSRLSVLLDLPASKSVRDDQTMSTAVVLKSTTATRFAVVVDEVQGEQEVLVKSMGSQLLRVENIAGAAMLGSGVLVPVLNVSDLFRSAVRHAGSPQAEAAPVALEIESRKVLVAEDSITARALLKNILEAAGYDVRVAIDGMEAWTALRTEEVDVVVSDVEMPRMNGFELTSRIRKDDKFSNLPVVLVTALESREDRERGVEVGANAYIVKSSFDQSNLLDVLKRLL